MSKIKEDFWNSILEGNVSEARHWIKQDRSLANSNFAPESLHSEGFPLFKATKLGNLEMVRLLLESGADSDSRLETDDPREVGMPLVNAFQRADYKIVNLLLDYDPDLNAHGYCATPFVDSILNKTWELPNYKEEVKNLTRKAFNNYLIAGSESKTEKRADDSAPDVILLLRRVIDMGGKPSLFTVVRHEHDELLSDLLSCCAEEKGTVMDYPQGTVFQNICYGASWCGYPKVLDLCQRTCPKLFTGDIAKSNIERGIRSHNRDGDIDDYFELIRSQLWFLETTNQLNETYSDGNPFLPLHWLANDFIEKSHYGFKCQSLGTEADIIRLARLFIDFGFSTSSIEPELKRTPAQTAKEEELGDYYRFLINRSAKET